MGAAGLEAEVELEVERELHDSELPALGLSDVLSVPAVFALLESDFEFPFSELISTVPKQFPREKFHALAQISVMER